MRIRDQFLQARSRRYFAKRNIKMEMTLDHVRFGRLRAAGRLIDMKHPQGLLIKPENVNGIYLVIMNILNTNADKISGRTYAILNTHSFRVELTQILRDCLMTEGTIRLSLVLNGIKRDLKEIWVHANDDGLNTVCRINMTQLKRSRAAYA